MTPKEQILWRGMLAEREQRVKAEYEVEKLKEELHQTRMKLIIAEGQATLNKVISDMYAGLAFGSTATTSGKPDK